ncbi:MAG: hypothetical protein EON58_18555 [Alphaproteobacteria bacterium]|nr:MAG: hypothetical protein EON58_18555 [Alphaproteobacteria bacterium]
MIDQKIAEKLVTRAKIASTYAGSGLQEAVNTEVRAGISDAEDAFAETSLALHIEGKEIRYGIYTGFEWEITGAKLGEKRFRLVISTKFDQTTFSIYYSETAYNPRKVENIREGAKTDFLPLVRGRVSDLVLRRLTTFVDDALKSPATADF